MFVSYLHQNGMSSKTIATYLSGISFVHKLLQKPDNTSNFLISTLLKGSQRLAPSFDIRLPITISMLDALVASLPHVTASSYCRLLFQAMFLFAFYAFARCSEIAYTNAASLPLLVQYSDLDLSVKDGQEVVCVTFRHFKHNYGKPHTISFSHGHTIVSVVYALQEYLKVRGSHLGPLFMLSSGLAVSRSLLDRQLTSCLHFCGFDSSRYKSHSFRIGRATDCALRGYSDAKIRALGRWRSNAFLKYIRVSEN